MTMRWQIAPKIVSGVLACGHIKPYGVWFIGSMGKILSPHARKGDGRIKVVAS